MSFEQGLSGLNAASKSLDVIGNNIANANTVGFKSSGAQFSDVYANSIAGSSSSAVGIGTQLATVSANFSQGNITTTNNPLDVAINGNGFYRMSDNGTITYSRDGQFHLVSYVGCPAVKTIMTRSLPRVMIIRKLHSSTWKLALTAQTSLSITITNLPGALRYHLFHKNPEWHDWFFPFLEKDQQETIINVVRLHLDLPPELLELILAYLI